MQDLQSCLGLEKARGRRKVWRNHDEHAGDTGERCRKRIHVVIVGFEELHALLLPLCRFLGIPYDSSNLLALCKKRARNGTAYIPSDSHDCIHMMAPSSCRCYGFYRRYGRLPTEVASVTKDSYQACYSGRAIPLRRSQIARSRSCLERCWGAGRGLYFL